ncbi:carbohydrate ABC transporter permease [Metabacillus sp. GX 13764]|nr:carbohydrate ABC transporter permease [Metabacillus kandeliae]MCD7033682.1 carbohydrate ABC transporter permease [Metabacillus kandeliae]
MTVKAKWPTYLILSVMSLIIISPVIWIVLSSFKGPIDLYSWPPKFFTNNPTFENFFMAFQKGNFGLYFWNSLVVTVSATVLTLIINTMAGYALSKYRFKGDALILFLFLSTLAIPLEVIMTPIFTVISKLGLYNNLLGLIIPPAATPMGVFLIRQYLLTVPDDLLEAARIDGASEWRIFWNIIIPIAKPVIAVLAIFSFMWRWDDYIWPLIVISDPSKYTIQLAIANFIGEFRVDWGSLLAMSVITMVPVLIVFIIFQKQFVKGIATSGLKD